MPIKTRVRGTYGHVGYVGPTPMSPDPLTPALSHLLSFNLVGCAKDVSNLINHPIMNLLGTRVGGTSSHMVTSWKFLEPQVESGISTITGICDPTDMAKKVCQRPADQTSSLS
jgi:hypothetical protein